MPWFDGGCRSSSGEPFPGVLAPDEEWVLLEPHLPKRTGRGRHWKSHRVVINGMADRLEHGQRGLDGVPGSPARSWRPPSGCSYPG
jgi:hypothetical protein